MEAPELLDERHPVGAVPPNGEQAFSAAKTRNVRRIDSLGRLYGHAFAIAFEAEARFSEFSRHMADCGNEAVAELFLRLAKAEAEHAFHLAKRSVGVEISIIGAGEYAWLENERSSPDAHAYIFRMMTPRLALEIALREAARAETFFDGVQADSQVPELAALASDFARYERSHIEWLSEALIRLPRRLRLEEYLAGDPTIEQQP